MGKNKSENFLLDLLYSYVDILWDMFGDILVVAIYAAPVFLFFYIATIQFGISTSLTYWIFLVVGCSARFAVRLIRFILSK